MDNADKKKKMAKYVSVKVKETTNNYQKKINNLQLEQSKQQHMISNHRNLLHELNLLD
jgi:arginine decarboxylase-like protein